MASINMSIRTDSELKAQAESVLSQLGMNMNGTINMFLQQIVRDKAVPLSLSLNSEKAVYADLLYAQTERARGYVGADAREVLQEMDRILEKPLHTEVIPYSGITGEVEGGSTDVGDVTYTVPTCELHVASACLGNIGHTWQMAGQAGSSIGHKGLLTAARAIAPGSSARSAARW